MLMYLQVIDTPQEKRKFVILYEKYRHLMMKVANDILKDCYWAEDAVHESFIKVAHHMEKIGEPDSVETKRYLIIVTKNTAIDIYRKRSKQMSNEIFVETLDENIEVSGAGTDVENRVLEILKKLPDKYKDVFLLKYSNYMENYEIAEVLGITEENVRKRISRGKMMIQKALDCLKEEIS